MMMPKSTQHEGVGAFFGKWPGYETDAELTEALNEVRKPSHAPVAKTKDMPTLRAIVTLCENALPGNERVVLDNIRDVAEAALKGRK